MNPQDVWADGEGSIWIADTFNHRIRKVDSAGKITTVAGGGVGDNGPATRAALFGPGGLDVDSDGNIYVAERDNRRVRRIDAATGNITTVAGTGVYGSEGDGGPATLALLSGPTDVFLSRSGDLYIADQAANVVRRLDATGTIHTVAGSGFEETGFPEGVPATQSELYFMGGIHEDAAGNLFIATGGMVRRVDSNGIITTVAGTRDPGAFDGSQRGFSGDGGPATRALLDGATDVTGDTDGNLYVLANSRIRRIDPDGIITTVAGGADAGRPFDGARATEVNFSGSWIALDAAGVLYVAQFRSIVSVGVDGTVGVILAQDRQVNADAPFLGFQPTGIALDGSGTIYFTEGQRGEGKRGWFGWPVGPRSRLQRRQCRRLRRLPGLRRGVWYKRVGSGL